MIYPSTFTIICIHILTNSIIDRREQIEITYENEDSFFIYTFWRIIHLWHRNWKTQDNTYTKRTNERNEYWTTSSLKTPSTRPESRNLCRAFSFILNLCFDENTQNNISRCFRLIHKITLLTYSIPCRQITLDWQRRVSQTCLPQNQSDDNISNGRTHIHTTDRQKLQDKWNACISRALSPNTYKARRRKHNIIATYS